MSHTETAGPKQWKCGDAFQYPLPPPKGDPWEVLLEPCLKRDKIRCDSWKEEVQTLLIFAGLFSAVVTSFVVTSVQTLQEDPNDVAVQLLARIADHLANSSSTSAAAPAPFAPTASAIRINTFWFISLILSLSTVLIGIVALQWLREHQRYTDRFSPKECVAVYHMREEALERWLVPQIFTGLPLLLQIALVLFFVGAAEYLCVLNLAVGIPVSVVIALALLFLGATTVLPTLQLFLLAWSGPSTKIPAQCAYKSPQSWAMHRLCAHIFWLGSVLHAYSPFPNPDSWALRWLPLRFGLYEEHESWITFDVRWLRIRNCYSMVAHGVVPEYPSRLLDGSMPQHDVSAMLAATICTYITQEPIVCAAYACFAEVSRAAVLDHHWQEGAVVVSTPLQRIQLLRRQNWTSYLDPPKTQPVDARGLQVMHEQHLTFFLSMLTRPYPEAFARGVGAHLLELQCRILQFGFSTIKLRMLGLFQNTYFYGLLPLYRVGWRTSQYISLEGEIVNESIEQVLLISREFFQDVDAEYESWFACDSQQDESRTKNLKSFLELPGSLVDRLPRSAGVHDAIVASIFQVISVKFDSAPQSDFLFFAATHFLYEFFYCHCKPSDLGIRHRDLVGALLGSLARYEARLQQENHPWTREESDIWAHSSLGKVFDRYRIGTWALLLAAYDVQPAGASAFDMPHVIFASRSNSQLENASVHQETHSVHNVVPDIVDVDNLRRNSNLSLHTSGWVTGRHSSTRSSLSVDENIGDAVS